LRRACDARSEHAGCDGGGGDRKGGRKRLPKHTAKGRVSERELDERGDRLPRGDIDDWRRGQHVAGRTHQLDDVAARFQTAKLERPEPVRHYILDGASKPCVAKTHGRIRQRRVRPVDGRPLDRGRQACPGSLNSGCDRLLASNRHATGYGSQRDDEGNETDLSAHVILDTRIGRLPEPEHSIYAQYLFTTYSPNLISRGAGPNDFI
jgi:hypothetical protein